MVGNASTIEAQVRAMQAAWLRQQARALIAPMRKPRPRKPETLKPRKLALALQGGGAHGAFTWGVLDRLLQEPDFRPAAISGTSAGAMNAVVLTAGWLDGGAEGAQARLGALWQSVANLSSRTPAGRGILAKFALDLTSHVLSPYQLNPLGLNPLGDVLAQLVDFDRLRRADAPCLFIAATDVTTGEARIFENAELAPDVVLASACLPQAFQAVSIDGRAYWDGGYASNPPLLPLVERAGAREVLLVQINPLHNPGLPTGAAAIRNRTAEIMFGRPLAVERALFEERGRGPFAWLDPARRRFARASLKTIDGAPALAGLDPATRMLPDPATVAQLKLLGHAAASAHLTGDPTTSPTALNAWRERRRAA